MSRRPIPQSRHGSWRLALAIALGAGASAAQPSGPLPEIVTKAPSPSQPAPNPPVAAEPATTAGAALPPTAPVQEAPAAPAEAKAQAVPTRRSRYDVAVLEALDKVTAESLRFEAPVGRPIRYKTLVFTVKACERSTADEPVDDSIAYLTIDSQPRPAAGKPALAPRQAFRGWMYASSPGLHPLEHPVYDAWLITCRTTAPVNPPAVAPSPTVASPLPKKAPPSTSVAPVAPPAAAKPSPDVDTSNPPH